MSTQTMPYAPSGDHLTIPVRGMTCATCAGRVGRALSAVPGVTHADVNLALETARIDGDAPAERLVAAVAGAGYSVPSVEVDLDIRGMTCAACAGRVERALKVVQGVLGADVNLALETARVTLVEGAVEIGDLVAAVASAGYEAAPRADTQAAPVTAGEGSESTRERVMLIASAAITLALIAPMLARPFGLTLHPAPWIEAALAGIVQFAIGARFYRNAWKALKAGTGNMDLLVALGTSAAYFYSLWLVVVGHAMPGHLYFEASATIITFVILGKWLEARAKRGSAAAVRALMALRPDTARIIRDGESVEIPAANVKVGDLVEVRPGERVPVDGTIEDGTSDLDEAMITGESIAVEKGPGAHVIGGTVNGPGRLRVRAKAVGAATTLARIVRLVEGAQAAKAPVQRLVDRVAAVFVPTVVAIAAATFAAWMVAGGGFEQALVAAVSVLVIACPCALGLATPAALVAGTGAAARAGILIRDIEALERAHRIDLVVFDKTGTLTEGRPVLTDTVTALGTDASEMLALAASAQRGSEHPIGRAVRDAASQRGLAETDPTRFRAVPGQGLVATVGGRELALGNQKLMRAAGIDTAALEPEAEKLSANGRTLVWVADTATRQALGLLAVMDAEKPESAGSIAALRRMGVETLLLTGDAAPVAASVARDLGIEQVRANVGPEEKAKVVAELKASGRVVAMVGDGINDAPALAAADVGIAMATGTDVALETAGIAVMRGDPRLVADALDVARATMWRIRGNLFWAFAYNIVGVPLAAAGYLSPALAGAAMAFSSVSVVANALFLRRWRPNVATGEVTR
jgi:Cu+-exporting ATPase